MKISVLLPYKENFSPDYPGAVSIFLNSVIKSSKYKKNKVIAGIQNGQPEYADKMIKKGFQLVTIGTDQRFMTAAAKAALSIIRKDKKKDIGKGY